MRRLPIYQVDAFSSAVFGGNPAAVVPLDEWLPDAVLGAIAAENNLSETAFVRPEGARWRIRWFTPTVEVDLCGHATLAAAWVIANRIRPGTEHVAFDSKSGPLAVACGAERSWLDFPRRPAAPVDDEAVAEALGARPSAVLRATKTLAVFETAAEVEALCPDMRRVAGIASDGVIASAPGRDCDFVSRYFAPHVGIDEDPVTGSAHCTLTPYWSERLGRTELHARQVSKRGGELWLEDTGTRVRIGGQATLYLEGTIVVP